MVAVNAADPSDALKCAYDALFDELEAGEDADPGSLELQLGSAHLPPVRWGWAWIRRLRARN
jgi:hypothetical protein